MMRRVENGGRAPLGHVLMAVADEQDAPATAAALEPHHSRMIALSRVNIDR